MKPQEIYNQIESAWKDAAVQTMVLKEITEGRQKANPEAFTFEQQFKGWDAACNKLRGILDALADLKPTPETPPPQPLEKLDELAPTMGRVGMDTPKDSGN